MTCHPQNANQDKAARALGLTFFLTWFDHQVIAVNKNRCSRAVHRAFVFEAKSIVRCNAHFRTRISFASSTGYRSTWPATSSESCKACSAPRNRIAQQKVAGTYRNVHQKMAGTNWQHKMAGTYRGRQPGRKMAGTYRKSNRMAGTKPGSIAEIHRALA